MMGVGWVNPGESRGRPNPVEGAASDSVGSALRLTQPTRRRRRTPWQTAEAPSTTQPPRSGPRPRPPATCRASATTSRPRRCRARCPWARTRRSGRPTASTPSSFPARRSRPRAGPTSAPGSTASAPRCGMRKGSSARRCRCGEPLRRRASTTAPSASCAGTRCRSPTSRSPSSRACAPSPPAATSTPRRAWPRTSISSPGRWRATTSTTPTASCWWCRSRGVRASSRNSAASRWSPARSASSRAASNSRWS